jgi:hypothetical protein
LQGRAIISVVRHREPRKRCRTDLDPAERKAMAVHGKPLGTGLVKRPER